MDFALFITQSKAEYTCDIEDYSPCACEGLEMDGRNFIMCDDFEVAVVMDVFNRTHATDLAEITIHKSWNDILIPNNLISNKKTEKLVFDCGEIIKATFEKDSFNSTRSYTTIIELYKCLLWQDSDLSFIDGFTKMKSLLIEKFDDMGRIFSTFPTNLPTLSHIKLIQCYGWDTLMHAPLPIVDARNFIRLDVVESVGINDDVMNVVIEWAVQSFNSTLKSLYIHSNNLTRIPSHIEFFGRIETLDMKNNFFPRILAGSLKITSKDLGFVDLSNCGVIEMEPNVFEGKTIFFQVTFSVV